ncbi:hypothetical protein QR680_002833 [Steinernema hermaphroditum]|uniref:Uncharacterized protein n=1 Tax=Steinernema hermaphroditum TaxID=289476 RepID=A0AA39H6E2_9BILA|nr:hypothetical protein QR680_002833 [Steinernema hermaphroditum]
MRRRASSGPTTNPEHKLRKTWTSRLTGRMMTDLQDSACDSKRMRLTVSTCCYGQRRDHNDYDQAGNEDLKSNAIQSSALHLKLQESRCESRPKIKRSKN